MVIILPMPLKLPKKDIYVIFYRLWMLERIAKISASKLTLGRLDGFLTFLRGNLFRQFAQQ